MIILISITAISIIILVLLYIKRREFFSSFIKGLGLSGQVYVVEILDENTIKKLNEGDRVFEESTELWYTIKNGKLITF